MTDESVRHLTISINRLSQLMEKQLSQREEAMQRWRTANPELARRCQRAAVAYNNILTTMLEEIVEMAENDDANDFVLFDFLDRCGPRLMHLNNLVQTLVQLGG